MCTRPTDAHLPTARTTCCAVASQLRSCTVPSIGNYYHHHYHYHYYYNYHYYYYYYYYDHVHV